MVTLSDAGARKCRLTDLGPHVLSCREAVVQIKTGNCFPTVTVEEENGDFVLFNTKTSEVHDEKSLGKLQPTNWRYGDGVVANTLKSWLGNFSSENNPLWFTGVARQPLEEDDRSILDVDDAVDIEDGYLKLPLDMINHYRDNYDFDDLGY